MPRSSRRPPLLVRTLLLAIRLVSVLVPRPDRRAWRQEWEAEILHGQQRAAAERRGWRGQTPLVRHSLGSLADAAWLRRQFTGDAEMIHDLRHTLRLLAARPAFTLVATLVLALGIGASTAVVSLVDALLLREPPFPDADRIVAIWERDTTSPAHRREVAPANFLDWRAAATTMDAVAAVEPWSVDYTGGDRPRVFMAAKASEGFFDILGVRPLHGRLFHPDDFTVRQGKVVVLAHALWQREFGGDPSIVHRAIPLDGEPHTVVGVLPPAFEMTLWLSEDDPVREAWIPRVLEGWERTTRSSGWWAVVAKMKDGVTIDEARAEFDGISRRLAAEHPDTNAHVVARVDAIDEHVKSRFRTALVAMLAAVGLVLLIACANVANLLLARGLERGREFAVRSALGASRGRLARQLVTESLVIGLAGAAAGIALAWAVLRYVIATAPAALTGVEHASLDWRLAGVAVALGVLTAAAFGTAPALHVARSRDDEAIREGRAATGTRRARRLRDALAVAEVALAVVVVVGAALLVRSFVAMVRVDTGFTADRVAVVQVFAYERVNRTPAERIAFFRETLDRMRRIPGVVEAGAVSAMPFMPANINAEAPIAIEGRPPVPGGNAPRVFVSAASNGYFETMGIELTRGRTFTAEDGPDTERVAVISRSLARRLWGDEDPTGAWVTAGQQTRVRIVGVVGELRHDGYDGPPRDELFLAQGQVGNGSMTYVLRAAGDPASVIGPAQEVIWSLDPLQTIYHTATVPELLAASVAPRRFALAVMAAFAVVALAVAAAGLYGVMSVAAGQRTREFGVRLALGASPREIAVLVLSGGLRLGLAGVAAGLAGAYAGARLFEQQLFDISAADPLAFGATAVVVLLAGLAASWLPARRATRVDPLVALRGSGLA
jgi:putative ABC transport system permease protein